MTTISIISIAISSITTMIIIIITMIIIIITTIITIIIIIKTHINHRIPRQPALPASQRLLVVGPALLAVVSADRHLGHLRESCPIW